MEPKKQQSCYIPDFCKAIVAWEFIVELCIYVWCILIREYNCENCYALEFMRLKFHELLEKSELKIVHWIDNPNIHKCNFWKLRLEWPTLKMKMKMKNEYGNENEYGLFYLWKSGIVWKMTVVYVDLD